MRSTTRAWRRNAFCRPGRLTLGEEDVPERAGLTTRRERRERVPITRDSLVEGKRHRAFDRGHAGSRGILPPGLALPPGRSEERRLGEACGRPCQDRWVP